MTDLQRVYAVAAATQRLVTRDHRIELPERLAAHLVVVEARRVLRSAGVEHDLAALDEETEHVIGPWRPGWWEGLTPASLDGRKWAGEASSGPSTSRPIAFAHVRAPRREPHNHGSVR